MGLGEKYLIQIRAYIQDFIKTYSLIPNKLILGIAIVNELLQARLILFDCNRVDLTKEILFLDGTEIEIDYKNKEAIGLSYTAYYKLRD